MGRTRGCVAAASGTVLRSLTRSIPRDGGCSPRPVPGYVRRWHCLETQRFLCISRRDGHWDQGSDYSSSWGIYTFLTRTKSPWNLLTVDISFSGVCSLELNYSLSRGWWSDLPDHEAVLDFWPDPLCVAAVTYKASVTKTTSGHLCAISSSCILCFLLNTGVFHFSVTVLYFYAFLKK